jgi:hypothetical protein
MLPIPYPTSRLSGNEVNKLMQVCLALVGLRWARDGRDTNRPARLRQRLPQDVRPPPAPAAR